MIQLKILARSIMFLALFLLYAPGIFQYDVLGQVSGKGGVEQEGKVEALRTLLETKAPRDVIRTRPVQSGRMDVEYPIMRAMYRVQREGVSANVQPPQQASEQFLRENATVLGINADLDDLKILGERTTRYSHHITYQQFYKEVPVYNRVVKVNLNQAGDVTMVMNGYAPALNAGPSLDTTPVITASRALDLVSESVVQNVARTSAAELMVYPSSPARLVWRTIMWTETPSIELEFLVDAASGEIVSVLNTSTHARDLFEAEFESTPGPLAAHVEGVTPPVLVQRATGTGFVFDPDPLTSSGQSYGPPFVDNDDGDLPEINQERILVELKDITQDTGGLFRLIGPHVQIVGETAGGTVNYTPPAEADANNFRYTRSDDYFESVNVYYHIDKSQRYLQSLDIGRDIQNVSIPVNPHGLGAEDNSRYYSNENFIAFGVGGVDDAEDPHVIWHEYGHALLEGSAADLLSSSEGKALHEGWADYWAASYARRLAESTSGTRDDWRALFKWDSGDGVIWAGREVTFTGTYPEDIFCDDGGFLCDIYADGTFWAATLMEMYDALGAEITDRLNLASHIYLSAPTTFQDAAEAIIQADLDLNNGAHFDFLVQLFIEKGLVRSESLGPVVLHTPLTSVEQLGGEIPVSVQAFGVASLLEQVFVVYSHPGADQDTLFLDAAGDDLYTGLLPLPETPGDVSYYVGAIDQFGLFSKVPDERFIQVYTFSVGPDQSPPVIQHVQQNAISLIEWPAEIRADVGDNLGVDTVYVDYYIDSPFGSRVAEGMFGLNQSPEGDYVGVFGDPVELLEPGSTVFYRILAEDEAIATNSSASPKSGYYGFNIVIEDGLFRAYDFEQELPGFEATGLWQQDAPEFGTRIAFSGTSLWATAPGGAYPDQAQVSSLSLPPMNLRGVTAAYLVFWHWFDTESTGNVQPTGDPSSLVWDGGNVKISVDEGTSWEVIEPESGYNGQIASARNNPLEGEPAFGGFSFGWRQVVFPIPTGGTLMVRFDFGTDSENAGTSSSFAGWYIDDVQVLTELMEDTEAPGLAGAVLPNPVSVRQAGQEPPNPFIEIMDNVGVESAFVDYSLMNRGSIIEQGRVRMTMDSTRLDAFYGALPFEPASINTGDIISYRITVSDFAGNEVSYPDGSETPFLIEYRLIDRLDLVAQANPTGLWTLATDTLVLRPGDSHEEISSLVFGPLDLPLNVDNINLRLSFTHEIGENNGGNIKISTDGAREWNVIEPAGGYDDELPNDGRVPAAMRGQSVFTGASRNPKEVTFDLFDYVGEQVWLRVDFAAMNELAGNENWRIGDISISYSTLEPGENGFDIPRSFAMYENYPDPFSQSTTISYTLESSSPVSLEIYDMLGRRIESLVQADQAAGTYTVLYNASQLSSGVYLARLVTNQGQAVEQLVVVK